MTTRCNLLARAAALLVLTFMLLGASALRAQDDRCTCDHYTIAVDRGVGCSITLCYRLTPAAPPLCRIVAPGTSVTIPCPVYEATITTCSGSYTLIGISPVPPPPCSPSLTIAPGCCVRACRGIDPTNCPVFTISATPCLTPTCP